MLTLLLTIAVPLVGAGLVFSSRGRTTRFTVLVATTLVHVLLSFRLCVDPPVTGPDSLVRADPAGRLFLVVISVLYCAVAVHLVAYTARERRRAPRRFLACHLLALAAISTATTANHWGLFWVAMEATTLASAPLIFYHQGARSLEATWKYLVTCSVGIALALLGTLFLGTASSGVGDGAKALHFSSMVANAHRLSVPWLRMGTVFLLVGYGTKMGLAPMHAWKPDAYGEAPPPVAALLSGGLTTCGFLGILRVTQLCDAAGQGAFERPMLLVLGLLSIALGAASMVGQANYRRLLAYSSVEHMGILALGLGVGGTAAAGAMLHVVNNAFNKGILFLAVGDILQATRTSEVKGVTGIARSMPVSAAFLVVGFLAATGLPPFGTFVSEFTILRGMIAAGHVVAPVLYLMFLAVAFIGMGSVVLGMVHGEPGTPLDASARRETFASVAPLAVLTALVLLLGIYIPPGLRDLIELTAGTPGGLR